MPYESVIGMEVHVELKTKSKMFCDCENGFGLEKEPNVHICPVCTGQPGSLPVINQEAIKMVIKTGLALNCKIAEDSFFERKNYFYPDLPKGYQISQYQKPLCFGGYLAIPFSCHSERSEESHGNAMSASGKDSSPRHGGAQNDKIKIGITRIHLEEDTGKLTHPKGADYSLVDFNRAGVPLMELVTEPDIRSGEQAKKFCQELQLILRYLDVSDADMEKGQMRCEVNISLREIAELSPYVQGYGGARRGTNTRNHAENNVLPERSGAESKAANNDPSTSSGNKKMGTKVEIKNLNSFKVVEKAIDYEIKRQTELLERGKKVVQETRGWDDNKGETYSQRIKEEAHDYRYFPEPDLPPLTGLLAISHQLSAELPELPAQKRVRFAKEFGLPEGDIENFISNLEMSEYFEQVCSELLKTEYSDLLCHPEPFDLTQGKLREGSRKSGDSSAPPQNDKEGCGEKLKKLYKLTANYLITEMPKIVDKLQITNYKLQEKITAENFAEFIVMIYKGIVSSSGAQKVLEEMFKTGADPSHIIETGDLAQVSDIGELEKIVEEAIKENPQPAADYKAGKEASLQFLVGQIMKKSKGKANPQVAGEILKKKLTK